MDASRLTENLPKNRYRDISPCAYMDIISSVLATPCDIVDCDVVDVVSYLLLTHRDVVDIINMCVNFYQSLKVKLNSPFNIFLFALFKDFFGNKTTSELSLLSLFFYTAPKMVSHRCHHCYVTVKGTLHSKLTLGYF